MAKKTPPLVIPVVVDASGVTKGLNDVNSRLKRGAGGAATSSGVGGTGQAGGFVAQGGVGGVGGALADYAASRVGTARAISSLKLASLGKNRPPQATFQQGLLSKSTDVTAHLRRTKEHLQDASVARGGTAALSAVQRRIEALRDMGIGHMEDRHWAIKGGETIGGQPRYRSLAYRQRQELTMERQAKLEAASGTRTMRVSRNERIRRPFGQDPFQGPMPKNIPSPSSVASSGLLGYATAASFAPAAFISATGGGISDMGGLRGNPEAYKRARMQELREYKEHRSGNRMGFFDALKNRQLKMTDGGPTAGEQWGGRLNQIPGELGGFVGQLMQTFFTAFKDSQESGPYNPDATIKTIEKLRTMNAKAAN